MTNSIHLTGRTALAACAVALVAASAASAHGTAVRRLTIYSVATQEQFMNHEDDRDRGKGNNPFGNFKDSTSATKESGVGPFAGDRSVFTFKLFSDSGTKDTIGNATLICQYSFNKNAVCEAAYVLSGGQLLGNGFFNFNAKTFSLAIIGGTGKYRGETGVMNAGPAPNHVQKLAFSLA